MIIERQNDHWTARGNGPVRPITVEGKTRQEAARAYNETFGDQYWQQESMTAQSEQIMAEIGDYASMSRGE